MRTHKKLIVSLVVTAGIMAGAAVLFNKAGILPNPQVTPGAINPDVTQATIQSTICLSGWTGTIRPPSSYTTALKIKQIRQYGYRDTKPADYEEDHLISLELGGSPTDPRNLWPESYNTTPNARDKDKVENYLHKQICTGTMTLKEAQKEISTDWVAVYKKMKGTLGAVDSYVDENDQ